MTTYGNSWRNFARTLGIIAASIALGVMVSVTPARAGESDILYIGDQKPKSNASGSGVRHFNAGTGADLGDFVNSSRSGLHGPRGLLLDTDDNLLLVDQNVNRSIPGDVLLYSGTNGKLLDRVISHTDVNAPFAPRGMVLDEAGVLYVADYIPDDNFSSNGRIAKFDAESGEFLGNLSTAGFSSGFFPRGLVFGPDGLLYASLTGNRITGDAPGLIGYVVRLNPHTGSFVDVFTSNSASGCATHLHRPEGLVFGPDGNLYVTAFRANADDTDKILIFDGQTGACIDQIDFYAVGQPRAFAQAILFGPNGRLFVPINGNGPDTGSVRRYDVATKTFDVLVSSAANGGPLVSPWYLTFGKTNPGTLAYDE